MKVWRDYMVLRRMPLAALYWPTDKVGGVESNSVTTWKPIYCRLQHNPMISRLSGGATVFMSCIAHQVTRTNWIKLYGGIFWKVFGATNQVCWAHCHVDESSDGPEPLVRDDHKPGRWGPRGTHVSQAPQMMCRHNNLKGGS
jgi:hypothetical protein